MNEIKKFGILTSSIDPNKLGATVQGAILGASSVIVYVAHLIGLNIGSAAVSADAVTLGSVASTLIVLFGLIRKVVVSFSAPVTPPTVQAMPGPAVAPSQQQ